MPAERPPRTARLTVDEIVDAALAMIDQRGIEGFSMRRLGAALGVDPMAIYHHLPNKQAVVAQVVERVLAAMHPPDAAAPWDDQVRAWARAYRAVVTAHPQLTYETIVNPAAAGNAAFAATSPLRGAIRLSGLARRDIDPACDLVVDFVHGAALGAAAAARSGVGDNKSRRRIFADGIDLIIDGIRVRAAAPR